MFANWIIVLPCWPVEHRIVPIEEQYALLRREIKGCQTFMGERISYARLTKANRIVCLDETE